MSVMLLSFNFAVLIYFKENPYLKHSLNYQFSLASLIRRWFLDMITEVSDVRILKFLEVRFRAGDVSVNQALETLVIAINHLQAIPELVEMAKVSQR